MGEIKSGKAIQFKWIIAAAVAVAATVRADDQSERVDSFGDPARLVFKGTSPFTDAQLRSAVATDPTVILAASMADTLDQYQQILKSRLIEGFQRSGFDRPQIELGTDPVSHDVVVTMNLGRRWMCGTVVIDGSQDIPVEAISRALTQAHKPAMFQTKLDEGEIGDTCEPGPDDLGNITPYWQPGSPARFDTSYASRLTDAVRTCLAEMGYFHPFLRVSVDPGEKVASLTLHLIDPGHKAVLRRIECDGLERNTTKSVQEFLKIKPGDAVTLLGIHEMQRRLFESGRFVRHTITVKDIPGDTTRVVLHLDLKETENVPLLSEPLSETDQAMIRFAKWCADSGADGNDWIGTIQSDDSVPYEAHFAWGGRRGLAMSVKLTAGKSPLADQLGDAGEAGLSLNGNQLGIYLPAAMIRFEGPCEPGLITLNTIVHPRADPSEGHVWESLINGQFLYQPARVENTEMLHVRRWFQPAAFLSTSRAKTTSAERNGSMLNLKTPGASLSIDAISGRPIKGQWDGETFKLHWTVQPHGVESLAKALADQSPQNVWASDRSLVSLASFAAQAVCRSNLLNRSATQAQRRHAADVLAKVLDPSQPGSLEQTILQAWAQAAGTGEFDFPAAPGSPGYGSALCAPAICGVLLSERLFQWQSWPAVVGRCLSLSLIGRGDLMAPECREFCVPARVGPLSCLVMSLCVRSSAMENSRIYASAGLDFSSADRFGQDCQAVLNGSPEMDVLARRLGENLRALNSSDVSAIAELLPPNGGSALRAAVAELQKYSGPVTQKQLEIACEQAWNAGLRVMIEAQLKRLSAAAPAPVNPVIP